MHAELYALFSIFLHENRWENIVCLSRDNTKKVKRRNPYSTEKLDCHLQEILFDPSILNSRIWFHEGNNFVFICS